MRHRIRRSGAFSKQRAGARRAIISGRPLGFEALEDRHLLSANLTLAGTQSIVGNTNIDASNDHATQQQNMRIDINPTNPLHLAAISQRNSPTTGTALGLYQSADGGRTWTTTIIDNTVDGLSATATRFDPSLAYDSNGNLYVAYGVNNGTTSTLIVATSANDGASFAHVVTVDFASIFGAVSRFSLATGPDGSGIAGHQAVYVAYNKNGLFSAQIEVSGSHDGGATFTAPVAVNDDSSHNVFIGDPSVGSTGQLYVSWFDISDSAIRIDRDLDGLFNGGSTFGSDITVVNNSTLRPPPLSGSGNFDLFFNQLVPAQPNHGINSLPEIAVDRSGLATNGNLYISFADLFSAGDNDTDIYVARSTNNGTSWTILPVAHSSATEFMPSIAVDQSSGSVNVMYYSTLGEASKVDSNVEIATSIDGGANYVIDQALSTATSQGSSVTGGNDLGDYNGLAVLDGTIQAIWADNRGASIELEAFTASASFSSATNANVLTANGDASGSATDDQFVISRSAANPTFVQVTLNSQLIYAGLIATLDGSNVNGLAGSDALTIDNSNGVVNLPIAYDGGTSATDDDKLAITGNPGAPIARETYLVGATLGTGTWVLDPNGSMGAGASGTKDGDELIVTFFNLEPVDSDVPAAIFDVIMNALPNDATISDGDPLNGANSLLVTDNSGTFESFRFANKVTARIMGGSGADRIEAANFTTASAGLAELDIYGHVAPDVVGQPADDAAVDTLNILRDPAGLVVQLFGQGGSDSFTVGNGNLSQLLSTVNVVAGDGAADVLGVSDFNRSDAVDYYVDPTTFAICMDPAPMDVLVHFDGTLEFAYMIGTQGPNRFDVTPSAATIFNINGENPTTAPGDLLSIRFAGVTNPQLTNVGGNGAWTFGNRQPVVFENIERFNYFPILVYAADAARNGKPTVKVFDADTKTLVTSFTAYETNYTSGVRVAVGDVNGDGIPEIITTPGRSHSPLVEVWNILGASTSVAPTLLESFLGYANSYQGGVNVAVGDVNGDGFNDIVLAPSRGTSQIHTFINVFASTPSTPFDTVHQLNFLAFKKTFIGGASVAAGDVEGDPSAEIIVGSLSGMRDTVEVFKGDTSAPITTPVAPLQTILPFANNYRGGVFVGVANIDADAQLEILVGAGVDGHSQLATYDLSNLTMPVATFTLYTGNGSNAAVRVAALAEVSGGGTVVTSIFAAQGPDGVNQEIRTTPPAGPPVDYLMENDPEFRDGFYIAADVNSLAAFVC